MKHNLIIVVSFLLLVSCANVTDEKNNIMNVDSLTECAEHVELKYAKEFSAFYLSEYDSYLIKLNTEKDSQQTICLYHDTLPLILPQEVLQIRIPVNRMATNTTTHLEFLNMLDELSSLCGICSADYVYCDSIYRLIQSNKIVELGKTMQIDKERLLMAHPQILFLSDDREKVEDANCSMIVCHEWKEKTALARAEWIKFFALFFDKYSLADSLFLETEHKYETWKHLAMADQNKPTVFAAGSYGDTWYLTGGDGYMSALYQDANATFCLADTMVGTVTCGLEWLLTKFQNADYWMNCQADCLDELDERLSLLKSVQTKNVYNFNKRSKKREHAVISDFYESAVAHPDLLLGDVVSVLHPDLFPEYETIYVDRLK